MFGAGGLSTTREIGGSATDPKSAPALLHGNLQHKENGPGGLLKIWKQRFISQKGTVITVFSSEYEQGPDNVLDTFDVKDIEKVEPRPKYRFSFEVKRKGREGLLLQAETQEVYARWMAGLADWQNFMRKNPMWGTGAEDAAADEAAEQLIVSLLEPDAVPAWRADLDSRVSSKLNSLNGLERLIGFYSSDPVAQQKAALEVETKRHVLEKLQEVQRRVHRFQKGDKTGVAREELHVIEERLKKQLSGFDGVEKLAAIYPPGSQQAQSVQLQLRLLSEGIAVLEQQKQRLNLLCQGAGGGEILADVAFDFEAAGEGELDLKAGDVVTVREKTSDEWWTGECNGRIGLFPVTYVVERAQPVAPPPVAAAPPQAAAVSEPAAKTARALYAFDAASDVELALKQDDIVTLLECDPGAEWWRGTLPDGRDGMFPSSYVQLIEQPAPKPVAAPVQQPQLSQSQPQPKPQPKTTAVAPPQQAPPQGGPKPIRQQPLPKPKMSQPMALPKASEPKIAQPPSTSPAPPTQQPASSGVLSPRSTGRAAAPKRQVPAKGLPPPPPTSGPIPSPAPITADVLYPFDAQNTGELTVSTGNVVEIVDTSHSDWTIVRHQGQLGAVPSNYLRLVSPVAGATAEPQAPPPPPRDPEPVLPPSPPVVKPTAVSNYVFTPEASTELALQPGDVITLSDYDPTAEWWTGSLPDGRSGVFPSSYVSLQY
eukprot:TRINITY_DN1495_c1_g2_i1.p1 TRINITY_DN1495_c1_g2~~TRINITY_DN1495_c1_g2_i1.p1  ORF type:complete len:710 (+),score=124.74 TRINITY_DN1495_c1_g2_i1:64-2193(+)